MSSPVEHFDARKYSHEKKKDKEGNDLSPSDDGTYIHDVHDGPGDVRANDHLTVDTSHTDQFDRSSAPRSASAVREQAMRLDDDLIMLEAERVASKSTRDEHDTTTQGDEKTSISRSRSRPSHQAVDEFDEATNPLHEKAAVYNPPEKPNTNVAKFVKRLHESSFLVRYITYIVPVVVMLLVPLLLGTLVFPDANVGEVRLLWFSVWLEIVWLTLWAGRVCANPAKYPWRTLKKEGKEKGKGKRAFFADFLSRLWRNLSQFLSPCSPASSPTMQRNGVIWPSS